MNWKERDGRNGEKEELHLSRIFMPRVKAVTLTARKLIFYLDLLPGANRKRKEGRLQMFLMKKRPGP
jgi:hypothetical protein